MLRLEEFCNYKALKKDIYKIRPCELSKSFRSNSLFIEYFIYLRYRIKFRFAKISLGFRNQGEETQRTRDVIKTIYLNRVRLIKGFENTTTVKYKFEDIMQKNGFSLSGVEDSMDCYFNGFVKVFKDLKKSSYYVTSSTKGLKGQAITSLDDLKESIKYHSRI